MKNLIVLSLSMLLSVSIGAREKFNLGVKGGANFSEISWNAGDYSSESVTKAQFGAFARFCFGRIYVQPEINFSSKGGEFDPDVLPKLASFDYNTMDVPVLIGFKLINGGQYNIRAFAGPLYSNIIAKDINLHDLLDKAFYKDRYMGIQYGLGFDLFFLTIDGRVENGLQNFYSQPGYSLKDQNYMISVGIKLF